MAKSNTVANGINASRASRKLGKILPVLVIAVTACMAGVYLGLVFGYSSITSMTVIDPADGWIVNGDLYIPRSRASPMPAVILSHGTGGDRTQVASIASAIAETGIMVLSIDLSGYGQSPYQSSDVNRQHDYMAAYHYLCNRSDVDTAKIGVAGFSLGGRVSCTCVQHIPVKFVASISYTWNGGEFSPLYPANIIFITGTSDTLMYPYQLETMHLVTGVAQPIEGVLYGSLANNTGRKFVLAPCGHGDAVSNQKVIDTVEEWFDEGLNGATSPAPSTFAVKNIIQYIGIAGTIVVTAWVAYYFGGRRVKALRRAENIPEDDVTSSERPRQEKRASKIVALRFGKGVAFAGLYIGSWVGLFFSYSTLYLGSSLSFVTGNLTAWVIQGIVDNLMAGIPLYLLASSIIKKLDGKIAKTVTAAPGTPVPASSAELTLHASILGLPRLLLATIAVLGIFVGGMVVFLQFSTLKVIPAFPNQWLTFLVVLPFSLAFAFMDQAWFGLLLQKNIAFQQNRKCFIVILASFLLKAGILSALFLRWATIGIILPMIILMVLSLWFSWWLNQFFKSIIPGFVMTGIFIALLLPVLTIFTS